MYAILLGHPEEQKHIELEAFSKEIVPKPFEVTEVEVLGTNKKPKWVYPAQEKLRITLPPEIPVAMATVLKIKITYE